MTLRSEYGFPLEYLHIKLKGKPKVGCILWREEIRAGINTYTANESLHLL